MNVIYFDLKFIKECQCILFIKVLPIHAPYKLCFAKSVTIQMKAIEQYFHAVLFIMLNKVVLTFESVDETLVCDHSIESY